MAHVRIKVEGNRPESPQEMVLAMTAFARELTKHPAEGVMLLLTAAVRVSRRHSPHTTADQNKGLAETLPWAITACDGFWPPDDEPKARPDAVTLQ